MNETNQIDQTNQTNQMNQPASRISRQSRSSRRLSPFFIEHSTFLSPSLECFHFRRNRVDFP